jgi:hypothetical protein
MVKVDEADPSAGGVTEAGLTVAPQLDGPLAVSDTVPLNPLSEVTVIAEVGESPGLAVIEDGCAVMEKSGVATAAKLAVSGLPRPVT